MDRCYLCDCQTKSPKWVEVMVGKISITASVCADCAKKQNENKKEDD